MKKGLLKKLTPVVIVPTLIALSALAGCQMSCNSPFTYAMKEDVYIIYNNTLHKGDVVATEGLGNGTHPTPEIHADCGLNRETSMYVASFDKPAESEYQFVCDECFHS